MLLELKATGKKNRMDKDVNEKEKKKKRGLKIFKKVCKLLDHLRLRDTKNKLKNTLDLLKSKMMRGMLPKMFSGQSLSKLGSSLTI